MRHFRILASFFMVITGGAAANSPRIPDAAEESKIAEFVNASGVPSVSVAVVDQGELVYARAFGKAELPNRAADASTRYFVGSISKQFTAAAILLAAEDGRLSLD